MRTFRGLLVLLAMVACGGIASASEVPSHCGSQGCIEHYSDGHNHYVFYVGLDGARILMGEARAPKSERTLMRHEMRLVAVEQIEYLGRTTDGEMSMSIRCGIDGWGWQMGDLTFVTVTVFPDGSSLRQWGNYTGQGRQMITSQPLNPNGQPSGNPSFAYNHPAAEAEGTPGECREEEKES